MPHIRTSRPSLHRVVVLRCLGFLLLTGLAVSTLPQQALAAGSSPTARYLCLIVLDAGKPEYITHNLQQLPTLRAFKQHARWYNHAWVACAYRLDY